MKIQLCNGGLANQVFQYIFARHLELATGEICYLDDSAFFISQEHNGYEMEKIWGGQIHPYCLSKYFTEDVWEWMIRQLKDRQIIMYELLKENGIQLEKVEEGKGQIFADGRRIEAPWNEFRPELLRLEGNIYYYGYWINKQWFYTYREEFWKEFEFPEIRDDENQKWADKINKEFSVAVHLRRRDYIQLGWSIPLEYYYNALKKISREYSRACFFVFSDDIDWCKDHAGELGFDFAKGRVEFVAGNMHGSNYIDMQLMSLCKGYIMSNSAFCYLAVLLNHRKPQIVINPTQRQI